MQKKLKQKTNKNLNFLSGQERLKFKLAIALLQKINALGFQAFIVGGAPRDLWLKNAPQDYDICSNINEKVITKNFVLKQNNAQFGNYVICWGGQTFQITNFRIDKYDYKKRFPKIRLTNKVALDYFRRDFTINTIMLNEHEEFIFVANAKSDLQHKILKTVINPQVSFAQDPLRILRAIKYALKYEFIIDVETWNAMNQSKDKIDFLPQKVLQRELKLIKHLRILNNNTKYDNFLIKYI